MKDILIVEDGIQERERLERLFRDAGYRVQACATVGDAEKCVAQDSFRIAILDIGLSDKSGSYFFNLIKRAGRVSYIIIFTGNPSVHLKQRFLDEGATDYIVKASPQAQNDQFLDRVRELIGAANTQSAEPGGIPLEEFLEKFANSKSKQMFLDMENSLPQCKSCGGKSYQVVFSHVTQVPPEVKGQVQCSGCGKRMDLEVE